MICARRRKTANRFGQRKQTATAREGGSERATAALQVCTNAALLIC